MRQTHYSDNQYHYTQKWSKGVCMQSANDYSPFGVLLDGRSMQGVGYRYGFGSHEKIDEVSNSGNTVDMGDRWLDVRLGRTSKIDRKSAKYPDISTYVFALNNPIGFVDPDGQEVIWHSSLRNNAQFKIIIQNLTSTDAYKQVYKRFIENQDNVVLTKMWQGDGSFAYSNPNRVMGNLTIEFASENFVNDKLAMDATFAAKVLLHEGVHQKWRLARDNEGIANYPTLNRNENDPNVIEADHETMAAGSIGLFVDGMKQFDAQSGTSHSDDWYNAMAWRGSLQARSLAYQKLDETTRAQYDKISQNETCYEDYLKAKYTYEKRRTSANKTKMEGALGKVNQKLFNQTRNRAEDAKVE